MGRSNKHFCLLACLLLLLCVVVCQAYVPPTNTNNKIKIDDVGDLFSYSGYLEINATTKASLFYWFFEAQSNNASAPLILWLQGGPGSSSISIGLLNELGPFTVNSNLDIINNPYSWNKNYHVLFIDQPVGTGFSFIGSGGYITNGQQMAQNLYTGLLQFFKLYPGYVKNDFYVFGESYGGKYVPYIANYILQQGSAIRLVGIGIGNGITDPVFQVVTYAEQAYNLGLLDPQQREYVEELQAACVEQTLAEQWDKAADTRSSIIDYISNASGDPNFYDVRTYQQYDWSVAYAFLNQSSIREQLHVANNTFNTNSTPVADAFKSDMMMSVKGLFPFMLDRIKVLLYQGQFDLRDGVASNEAWIRTIPWAGRDAYNAAPRNVWRVGGNVAGMVKNYKALTQLTIVGAGHMVPMNQPLFAQTMVSNFIENNPWAN